eukprot:TRINITY_DN2217_c0_g1_i2.p1 TRINITY_DN2217_c0_g1~~TRINITY_DN2217_c0_g1_i2.p1  ORF type:complete len:331 (+),score=130.78 TRINITY_DN2217_c0_g1_i2:123-1115(+)
MGREESRKKKFALWLRLWKYLDEYKKILVVRCSNLTATLFQDIRQALRPLGATILMGKNTLLKAGIRRKMEEPKDSDDDYEIRRQNYRPMPELDKLIDVCNGYIGLIFCRDNLSEVKDKLKEYKCIKGAKVGVVAPCDVFIQPGPTGLDPKQTNFFQALNIQTKIVKTQIEILHVTKIISQGQKISASECALLDKLSIKPFIFELKIQHVYDNGVIYSPTVLDIGKAEVIQKLRKGATYLTAAALQTGYPTTLSARQMLLTAFKNMLSFTMTTDYSFKQAEAIKAAVSSAPVAKEEEKEKEEEDEGGKPAEEKKEEEEMVPFGNIFGDDE